MRYALCYDIEIVNAIPSNGSVHVRLPDIKYCDGWHDKKGMGVSVICAYDHYTRRYRVWTQEGFSEFEALAKDRLLVGFNSLAFDDEVLREAGINVRTDYDLFREMQIAAGLGANSQDHAGFSLDVISRANYFRGKSGWGGDAPIDWQRGNIGRVIDYCLNDVYLLWMLIRTLGRNGELCDPRNPGEYLRPAPLHHPSKSLSH